MDNIILFDIDGTLFNPEQFGRLIRSELVGVLNIGEEELIRATADYYANLESTTDFNPREMTSFFSQRYGIDQGALDRVFWENENIYKQSLFPESEEVLSQLAKSNTLGIYSQGNQELQERKLEAGGIRKYFSDDYIFIHSRKISDEAIALLPREATVLDDNHDVVVKIAPFVKAVWINRRTQDSDPQFRTIHNLKDFIG